MTRAAREGVLAGVGPAVEGLDHVSRTLLLLLGEAEEVPMSR